LASGAGNLLSAFDSDQVHIDVGSSGNTVQGNKIGTDVTGKNAVGNGGNEVDIVVGSGESVGGAAPGAGNVIAYNGNDGVLVTSGNQNLISENSMCGRHES
jgi:hypothetical protein